MHRGGSPGTARKNSMLRPSLSAPGPCRPGRGSKRLTTGKVTGIFPVHLLSAPCAPGALKDSAMGRNKQVSDEDVLKAAQDVFVERGFGASTREIARRAGISEAVLYQRHRTKLDLFFAAMIPPPIELAGVPDARRDQGVFAELEALAVEIMKYFREAMPV